ncbi:hypothetical protein CONLIGDRAFT_680793 [Coniochaeta ligniaria NRRL 30616]|uniref:Uncharacterized protein n=1 Tax=Coniochaeta ligniaria NRRL 30616 TaxID=1408157 RepID=A0A1J7IQS9_9PEZI|nr:hypothetical protein CONLIGDRAFT_680793 [Coniochaeta ligniaria NRRL 30616]
MAFGNSVDTLIEVYSNCISLLKAFKCRGEGGASRRDEHNRRQVQLRKSLRSDRERVQRAYSSAVSETGSRFERGDDHARSALSRVLNKLKAAITNILRSASKHQQPALDYESLMLLSNASRSETLRTFDQLSRRLGSTSSRLTVVTTSTSPKRRSGHSSSGSTASSKNNNSSRKDGPSARKTTTPRQDARESKGAGNREVRKEKKSKSTSAPAPQHKPSPGVKKLSTAETVPPLRSRTPARQSPTQTAVPNRLSLASIATDSTKLGEIPERKWSSRHTRPRNSDSTLDDSEYYNVTPVFPLKPYESPVKERRFLGLFRRRS